jgi:hypothetical protein
MIRSEAIREAEKDARYWAKRLREATDWDRDACERYEAEARRRVETLRQSGSWRP